MYIAYLQHWLLRQRLFWANMLFKQFYHSNAVFVIYRPFPGIIFVIQNEVMCGQSRDVF